MPTASEELLLEDDAEFVDCTDDDRLVEFVALEERLEEELAAAWLDWSGEGVGALEPPPPPQATKPRHANNPISKLRTEQPIPASIH